MDYAPRDNSVGPQRDLYSLGKVLYQLCTGKDAKDYPELPTNLDRSEEVARLLELNEIILVACHSDPAKRFASATAMRERLRELLRDHQSTDGEATRPDSRKALEQPGDPAGWVELRSGMNSFLKNATPVEAVRLDCGDGAVPLDSPLYVVRPADSAFRSAISRRDSIVLVKGARQMGKTSLLARGLDQARMEGVKVVVSDFQAIEDSGFESLQKLYWALGDCFAEQLELEVSISETWEAHRGPNGNFEHFLRRHALRRRDIHVVWVSTRSIGSSPVLSGKTFFGCFGRGTTTGRWTRAGPGGG